MRKISYALMWLIAVLFIQSCVKDPITIDEPGTAPELPGIEMFVMPFQGFDDADTSNLDLIIDQSARNWPTHYHWFFAASNIVVWNTLVTIHMAIPVASFVEAFNHDPQYKGNGIWLWSYRVEDEDGIFIAELTGKILSADEVQWDMNISQEGGFSKVHWYTGITAVDGSKASWKINYLPENPTPYVQIDFSNDEGKGEASLRYTNIVPGSPDRGDYLEYKEFPIDRHGYDRSYKVFQVQEDNLLEIEWNEENHHGRVRHPGHFGTTDWQCWDGNYVDVDC